MDNQTKEAILKRINKGVPLISIQDAFGVSSEEICKLAGLKPKKEQKTNHKTSKGEMMHKKKRKNPKPKKKY